MASPPSATPAPTKGSGPGRLVALLLLPVVVILGVIAGTALSGDGETTDEVSVVVDEGTIDGTEWRVDAVRDVEGDICAFLYEDGAELTGACTLTPQDATFGDQTVVFGRAASDSRTVAVALDDGRAIDIETKTVDGVEGRFYAEVVDGDVDAEGLVP